jgi:hypothetical protein
VISDKIKSRIKDWTQQETIKLIELLESQGENQDWDAIVNVR